MVGIFFWLIATVIITFIKLPFNYTNGFELLIGEIVVALILYIIDTIFYLISYSMVGWIGVVADLSSEGRKRIHWLIRTILCLILLAVSFVPSFSRLLTFIIHTVYLYLCGLFSDFTSAILNIFV